MIIRGLFILLISCVYSYNSFAQIELAIVQDTDGFSNIREAADIQSSITSSIPDGSLTYVEKETTNWYKCYIDDNFKGFIHQTRLVYFESLEEAEKCQKITEVFNRQLELDSLVNVNENWKNDSISRVHIDHTTRLFHPITMEATKYICSTKDLEILKLFQKVMLENRGSAAEAPKDNFAELVFCLDDTLVSFLRENWDRRTCLYWKGNFQKILNSHLELKNHERKMREALIERLAKNPKDALLGEWICVQNYSAAVSSLSQSDVDGIKSEKINIKIEGITLFKTHHCYEELKVLPFDGLDTSLEDMRMYCIEYKIAVEKMGFSTAELFVFSGSSDYCYLDIIKKKNGNILIPYGGVFFEYEKI